MPTLRMYSTLVTGQEHPPLILIHGAANSASVWRFWQEELAARGWTSHALSLRGHGQSEAVDLSETRMGDYVDDVVGFAQQLRRPPILVGWSMGGLVAMMAAAHGAAACVGLAPSVPARVRDPSVPIRAGVFGPEEYGIADRNPDRQSMMPDLDREERVVALESLGAESRLARDERKAGIIIERLGCPLLIVTGTADSQWPRERYQDLHLGKDQIEADGASHWGLVLNRRVLPKLVSAIVEWVQEVTGKGTSGVTPGGVPQ